MIHDLLHIKYPIIQGAMANITDGDFAAVLSNCGALGTIATGGMDIETARKEIERCRRQTRNPFAVNIMVTHPQVAQLVDLVIELKVPVVVLGAGNPGVYMPQLTRSECKVIPIVSSVALARRMERAGADALICEGMEAGGHIGQSTTMALLPQVVDAVSIPVVAAGGIADGRGMNAAFALGAQGIQIGTRLLTAQECPIHDKYKQAVLRASDTATVVTGQNIGSPVRILKNEMSRQYIALEKKGSSFEELEKLTLGSLRAAVHAGDIKYGSVMMGQIAGLCKKIEPAQAILDSIMKDSERQFDQLKEKMENLPC